ncbi:2-dehydro-3-deoxy-D-gluconate 5-dehydrogenase KduD [Stappia sp. F7233]|uniref:2-dehydro-3-deoxy-D-gluconate 5-dehydrogenase KduD n=1 Tax=Stappia albiluteola TaxID=2758565 RepID=A0A839AEL0_9HYPH|nr:2-dehydro-3-deoxy-D-gluconate 5-dehydrogenase KduD [Stappia albiluteola]
MKGAFSLEGRKALVTGGAAGLGQAIAVALAEAGADVAITTHHRPGDETLAAISRAGRQGLQIATNLTSIDAAGAQALIDEAEGLLNGLDILVNNAGIIRRADAAEHGAADWRAVLSTNLDAVWYLSQAAGRSMLAHGGGRIVNIASLLSFQGGIRVPGYAAAKHGVAGLTKALANEWAPHGIAVNAIAPGYIETSNTEALRADPDRSRQILERIPAGRWGGPEDIAAPAVFLASPAAAYIHGHVLTVDGGWMAR